MLSPWKNHFPSLIGSKTHYLDSAATTQVPSPVIDAIGQYLTNGCGNPGRGSYSQSELATQVIYECRTKIGNFIKSSNDQIIFTKGTTESINLVAYNLREKLTEKDSILVTQSEHHANLLPWQRLCEQTGAKLNILPIKANGELDHKNLNGLLKNNCKLFAFSHCSNVIGFINPVKTLCKIAREHNVETLVDGAQAISHEAVNVKEMDCDYYAFSGHKIYASAGSGVLYAKEPDNLNPLLLGGGIVKKTSTHSHELLDGARKLEAGSSNMTALTGLNSAIDYIQSIGLTEISKYEKLLTNRLYNNISELKNFTVISHPSSSSIVSFFHKDIHCHDIASILAASGISVRAGHHCAEPCVNALGVKHCLRVSVGLYNDSSDIDALIAGLVRIENMF